MQKLGLQERVPSCFSPVGRRGWQCGWNRDKHLAGRTMARGSTTCFGPRFPALNRAACGRRTELALHANTGAIERNTPENGRLSLPHEIVEHTGMGGVQANEKDFAEACGF